MKTISVNNSSFAYAQRQIHGLTHPYGNCSTIQEVARSSETTLRKEFDGADTKSFKYLFARNFGTFQSANLLHSRTILRKQHKLHGLIPGKCDCVATVHITDMFEESDEELLSALCGCSESRNIANDIIELRTCHPGMPAVGGLKTIKLGVGNMETIDVLAMAVFHSPLEYVLFAGASLPCRKKVDLDATCVSVRTYKEFVSEDAQFVMPVEGKNFPFVEAFDSFRVCMNETSKMMYAVRTQDFSNFTILVVQLIHLAKASFLCNKVEVVALTAFLNCAKWKLHLLAVFASKEKYFPTLIIDGERVVIDEKGTSICVFLGNGEVRLESEENSEEKWFKITKYIVEHLFNKQLYTSLDGYGEDSKWMLHALIFMFSNAGCSISDSRASVQLLDLLSARAQGCMETETLAISCLRNHALFSRWFGDILKGSQADVIDGSDCRSDFDDEEEDYVTLSHNGMPEEVDNETIPRNDVVTNAMVMSKNPGWSISLPVDTSFEVSVTGLCKGLLWIQFRRLHFRLIERSNRQDPMQWTLASMDKLADGLCHTVDKNERQELSAITVAELVLGGKAGRKAGRWLFCHLMNGSVDIGKNRPTYLQHLPIIADGIAVTSTVGMTVLKGLEVVGTENEIFIVRNEGIPNYRIAECYQGTAMLEQCESVGEVRFKASIQIAPMIM